MSRRVVSLVVVTALTGCFAGTRDQEREVESARDRVGALPLGGDPVEALLRAPPTDADVDVVVSSAPTLRAVQDAAVRRNPTLKAALERWVAFLERVPQKEVPAYPTFRYGYSSMFKMDTYGAGVSVPFPAKLVTEARAALAEAGAAGADFRADENALRAQAALSYASLWLARRELVILDENLALLDRFVEVVGARYRTGTARLPDVLRVETERENLRADRDVAAGATEVAVSALNVLLDRHPDAPIGALEPLPGPVAAPDLRALYERALEHRPELRAARERAESSELMVSRAQQEWVPDLEAEASYVRDFGTEHNFFEMTAGVSIPWLFAPAIAARLREAEASARRARSETRATRNMVLDEVKSSFARTEAAGARFRRLEAEVIPRVRKNLEASEAAYVAGQIDFLTLIDTQRTLLTSLLARESALAELASRRAELVKAVGGSLAPE
jgi:outer membrane protein TolC